MDHRLFTEKVIRDCIGTLRENVASGVKRAKKGLDTAIFVENIKEAQKAESMINEYKLTKEQRNLIILWPMEPESFFKRKIAS